MKTINANLSRMPQVSILGFPALLSPHRISRSTVHFGLYQYELQGDFDIPDQPIFLMNEVEDNLCGTVLTTTPMLLGGTRLLILDPGDIIISRNGERLTPAEFDAKLYGSWPG